MSSQNSSCFKKVLRTAAWDLRVTIQWNNRLSTEFFDTNVTKQTLDGLRNTDTSSCITQKIPQAGGRSIDQHD